MSFKAIVAPVGSSRSTTVSLEWRQELPFTSSGNSYMGVRLRFNTVQVFFFL